ncbi:MAG: hypothetical protein JO306_02635 [Gemmatimonadetes bacterium]|nr:hypothetical protein [Gemmatimonadota bacterium]
MSTDPEEMDSEPMDDAEALIAEIRAVRHRISAEFGHDPHKLVAYLMEKQKEHADRLIPPPESPE